MLHLAQPSAPIRQLILKEKERIWSAAQNEAFSKIKTVICSAPTLARRNPNQPILLCADSSSFVLRRALLQHQPDYTWRPVTYVPMSLSETETRYTQIEKEALVNSLEGRSVRKCGYLIPVLAQQSPKYIHSIPTHCCYRTTVLSAETVLLCDHINRSNKTNDNVTLLTMGCSVSSSSVFMFAMCCHLLQCIKLL